MSRLATTARALFETRYTEDRMLKSYRQLYRELLELKSPASARLVHGHRAVPVRKATSQDLPRIVAIHQQAFSRFFLTRMGSEFLRLYYQLVLDYRSGIVLVTEDRGTLSGFVCGFLDPAEFYRLMWRRRRAFALPALSALLRHPSLAVNMAYGVRRIQASASQASPRSCELSSIAVAPEAAGNGLGKRLIRAFLAHSWSMQAQCVYLTTDADNNEGANTLYRDAGLQQVRRFLQRKGRWMNEYVIQRAAPAECREVLL
jgi:ribosomal protein S18 acetylase RimI-like enzyme